MRAPTLLLAIALSACGGGVPLEEVNGDPIAFVRQRASEGIVGITEFRRALRIENEDEPGTLQRKRTTSVSLITVPTREIRTVPDLMPGSLPLDWTLDGTRLLIGERRGDAQSLSLKLWNRVTGAFDNITPGISDGLAALGPGPIRLVSVGPVIDASGSASHGMRMHVARRHPRAVPGGRLGREPDVSADGRRVVFTRLRRGRSGRSPMLVLASLGGAEPVVLGRGSQPRFSRDGDWIVFVRVTRGVQNVWLMRSDGSAKRLVVQSSYDEVNPAVSPDGRHVVFASVRGGDKPESQLYLARVADGQEIQLTRSGQNGRPVW